MEILRSLSARVDPAHTAVLVVDVQNDFCAEGGYIHKTRGADMSNSPALAERITALVEAGRERGATIVWVQANYEPRFLSPQAIIKREECRPGLVCCAGGSWGAEFYKVAPKPEEMVIEKHSFSTFFGTELDRLLRFRGIKTLIMTGVATTRTSNRRSGTASSSVITSFWWRTAAIPPRVTYTKGPSTTYALILATLSMANL